METRNLFEALWVKENISTLEVTETVARDNREVEIIKIEDVNQRSRRLKPRGAPRLDSVTKKGIRSYPYSETTLVIFFNIVLFLLPDLMAEK